MRLKLVVVALGALLAAFSGFAQAAQTNVAVAANFTEPAKEIAALFKQKTGHEAVLSFGASGGFFTQIQHDAPYQGVSVRRPGARQGGRRPGLRRAGSVFTYAIGKLVLWSRVVDVTEGEATLKAGKFAKLSIANPNAAPYGTAAIEAMKALGVYDCDPAEDRPGREHRPGLPVRRHQECGTRLCRPVADQILSRAGRAGSCRRRSIRRSVRTRCS